MAVCSHLASVSAAPQEPAIIEVGGRDARELSFDQLASFEYPLPGEAGDTPPEIPAAIRALDGQRVTLTGFLLPFQGENGLTTQGVLLRSQLTCCYGVAPAFTEFVLITAGGDGFRTVMDVPITLVGTLKVGEKYEDGFLVGIYHLETEGVVENTR